jgi:hypothetical protein
VKNYLFTGIIGRKVEKECMIMRAIRIAFLLCSFVCVLFATGSQNHAAAASIESKASVPTGDPKDVSTQHKEAESLPGTRSRMIFNTIAQFYQEVESKNYSHACSAVNSDVIVSGKILTKGAFAKLAQSKDGEHGRIKSFSFAFEPGNPTKITMNLMRTSGLYYNAHIQLQQKNGIWKIVQMDMI